MTGMRRAGTIAAAALGLLALAAGNGLTQVSVNALHISPLAVFFPGADPDTTPLVPCAEPVVIEVVISNSSGWQITVRADGPLKGAGGPGIPASQVGWTAASSPPFISGTLSDRAPQLMAQGSGRGVWRTEVTFFLVNEWGYRAGDYSNTVTFTLSSI